jgi:hypothetical protein
MRRFTTAAPAIILALTSMLLILAVPGLVLLLAAALLARPAASTARATA